MTTIYAVESGDYSDYNVDALFTHRADAELYQQMHGGEVVERILDPDMTEYRAGRKPYWVIMKKDSTVRNVEPTRRVEPDRANHQFVQDEWIFYMWATDEQHAIKIANERRAMLIATGAW